MKKCTEKQMGQEKNERNERKEREEGKKKICSNQ